MGNANQNHAVPSGNEACKASPVLDAARPLKLRTANGAFIPEVREQVLIPANCGVSGHFWFQENGGNCMMCQRTAALEIENKRLRQEEQHFLNQQEMVVRAVQSIWPRLKSELLREIYATIPVTPNTQDANTPKAAQ